jgi:hypothetical protein
MRQNETKLIILLLLLRQQLVLKESPSSGVANSQGNLSIRHITAAHSLLLLAIASAQATAARPCCKRRRLQSRCLTRCS